MVQLELLESRCLLSAVVTQATTAAGLELRIKTGPADDQITVAAVPDGLSVTTADGTAVYAGNFASLRIRSGGGNDLVCVDPSVFIPTALYGGRGNDTLIGGSADDRLYGGLDADRLRGRRGDDTLVSLGDSAFDTLSGGGGLDSFWVDTADNALNVSNNERAAGGLHRVAAFEPYRLVNSTAATTSVSLGGVSLADPVSTDTTAWANFSNKPLFAPGGPSPDDVVQGYVGDCYFLASLSSIARADAGRIRQSIAALGDGTYGVRFYRDGRETYLRVDADLPIWYGTEPLYADLGGQDALWVALMEKAFAFFRDGSGTYDSLNGGWMTEAYTALGLDGHSIWSAKDATSLLNNIDTSLAANRPVTWAVVDVPKGLPLIAGHAYSVAAVQRDASGNPVTLVLRNPWGSDGAGSDGRDDGYVTLTAVQAFSAFTAYVTT